jgi:hypothetical protein
MEKHDANGTQPKSEKEVWTEPTCAYLRAGDAELGATPLFPEGAFGKGS